MTIPIVSVLVVCLDKRSFRTVTTDGQAEHVSARVEDSKEPIIVAARPTSRDVATVSRLHETVSVMVDSGTTS